MGLQGGQLPTRKQQLTALSGEIRERNVLFNDALDTFYLRLYVVRYDSEKGNPPSPHRLLLLINSGFFYMHHPTDRITHPRAFVTPVVEHWLEREIAQWVHHMKDRSDDPSHHERMLLPCFCLRVFNNILFHESPHLTALYKWMYN